MDTLNVVAETISTANNGTVVINSDGSFTYTSAANYNGVDSFDYTLEDGQGASDTGTVNITVNAVNDAPVLTNNGASVDEDGVLTISTTMLNAIDVDNVDSELTFTINGIPSNGTLFLSGVALAIDDSFTMQDVINDAVSFIPDADVNGLDGFNFTLSDGTATLASDTFDITVNPINDNPIAVDDAFSALADVETTGNLLVDNGYGLDSDIDGDTLDVTAGTYATAEGGSITVLANGDFTYTPDDAFTGTDSVDYTLDDGNGGTDIGTATFTVAQNVINGTASADSITGTNAGDSITGGEGDDTISGGAGNDTYHFARGDDADLVDNYDTLSLRDLINFDDDIAYDQLWFAQDGNDLEISVIGTNDSVTVDDWYSGNDYQVDLIQSGDGYELTGGEVQTLVNAMSSMTPPPFGQTDLTPSEHAILDSILDNVWDPVV